MVRLALVASALELFGGAFGYVMGGPMAMAAAMLGAAIATGAQVGAVALLRPAMRAQVAQFQQRWVLGTALRFASFIVMAVLVIVTKDTLPPVWVAAGYLATLLVLLFSETRFL